MLHRLFGNHKKPEHSEGTPAESTVSADKKAENVLEKEDQKYQKLLGATPPKIEMTISNFKTLPGNPRFKRR